MTINNPDSYQHGLGVHNPFADYLKFLPKEILLPTFYTPAERELLLGTSLSDALKQKAASLEREFDNLREATQVIPWCQRVWWDDQPTRLDIEDWKLADAIYRSRALELPRGAGVGMVPVLDMANHASEDHFNAHFEVDETQGQVLLVARDNKSIRQGEEITIMYGVGGACEMIFSYGFLDEHATSAREMFLDLPISFDDPLRLAKIRFAQEAPGVRLYVDQQNEIQWESTFVWWACVNQEDGLDFRVEQAVTGDTELKAVWNDQDLQADGLQPTLRKHRLYDVFLLRATVTIQNRVESQGITLAVSQDSFEAHLPDQVQIRTSVYETIGRLRSLETDLLTRAYETLEEQVT
ncbi:uncharacterized protein A1O9_05408 [Exophiala aquamarina CBS 119918]|uniref:SET domain-containing protein n=1 Tax=Exophiala aquamarina CBS 119918 TaxID=1182545 RepID=A0A072PCA9_9EURO|nr:uncharacterized protein A1O9_05408 [Exophiala aquamarina CBS 119918]KEF57491.1 hypothetical protein A1O9_05408 [Exophiala aquamarina CBS 119918]